MSHETDEPETKVIFGAGGLVRDRDARVLLLRDATGAWVFPKGHLERGETPSNAALREVYEESGVKAQLETAFDPDLGETRYINASGVLRQVRWFAMRAVSIKLEAEPGCAVAFSTFDDARGVLSYVQDQMLLDGFLARIRSNSSNSLAAW